MAGFVVGHHGVWSKGAETRREQGRRHGTAPRSRWPINIEGVEGISSTKFGLALGLLIGHKTCGEFEASGSNGWSVEDMSR